MQINIPVMGQREQTRKAQRKLPAQGEPWCVRDEFTLELMKSLWTKTLMNLVKRTFFRWKMNDDLAHQVS